MDCSFCGEDRKLIDAHIIPRSFHQIDSSSKIPHRLLTNAKGRYAQIIRKGVYDSAIVCEQCERQFSNCDAYAHDLFIRHWAKFDMLYHGNEHIGYSLPTFDYSLLKMFFLSLLWRASASNHPMYAKIQLGPRATVLKDAIRCSDPGDVNFFGVILQAFDSRDVGLLDPHPERLGHLRYYRFYLAHVIAFIKVDSLPFDEPFSSMAIAPNVPLVLATKSFANSPEREIMKDLVLANRRRQKGQPPI